MHGRNGFRGLIGMTGLYPWREHQVVFRALRAGHSSTPRFSRQAAGGAVRMVQAVAPRNPSGGAIDFFSFLVAGPYASGHATPPRRDAVVRSARRTFARRMGFRRQKAGFAGGKKHGSIRGRRETSRFFYGDGFLRFPPSRRFRKEYIRSVPEMRKKRRRE